MYSLWMETFRGARLGGRKWRICLAKRPEVTSGPRIMGVQFIESSAVEEWESRRA
jgi:hypothetical protein